MMVFSTRQQFLPFLASIACLSGVSSFSLNSIPTTGRWGCSHSLLPKSLPSRATALASTNSELDSTTEFNLVSYDFSVKKPMGVVLEEREENEAAGVNFIIDDSLEFSFALISGVRTGDFLTSINGKDVTSSSFDEVLEEMKNSPSPVSLTVQRKEKN